MERRTVAFALKSGKLTAQALAKVLSAAGRKIVNTYRKGQTPHGRQSVKKLMNHGVATSAIPLSGETRQWDRIAREFNVDYAFYKTGAMQYQLFFKSGQADAITQAFEKYSKVVMARENSKRPSIRETLKRFAERTRSEPRRQQEKTREAEHGDR